MRMLVFILVLLFCEFSHGSAQAQDNCEALRPAKPERTDESFSGKIEGEVSGLVGRLAGAGASANGSYRSIVEDQLKDYPNSDKIYILERTIYLVCKNPGSDIDLNSLLTIFLSFPAEKSSNLQEKTDQFPEIAGLGTSLWVHQNIIIDDDDLNPNSISISPDSQLIAVGFDVSKIHDYIFIYDSQNGNLLYRHTLDGSSGVQVIKFHPSGRFIGLARGNRIEIIEFSTGHVVFSSHGHSRYVRDISFSDDGLLIGSVSDDGTACVSSIYDSGRPRNCYKHMNPEAQDWDGDGVLDNPLDQPNTIIFLPNGREFYTGSVYGYLRRWRIANLKEPVLTKSITSEWILSLSLASDPNVIAFGSKYETNILDLSGDNIIKINSSSLWTEGLQFDATENSIFFRGINHSIFLARSSTGIIISETRLDREPQAIAKRGWRHSVHGFAAAPNNRFVAIAGKNPAIAVLKLEPVI
ncbi:WD40 repeat domain-containing protein [Oricola sp.]|uniref:WD40 repeat domain-containing protein n=1 Tax=Oricola sp. TaxID=1979950 RepID=UPI003516E894